MCVNNLPKVVTWQRNGRESNRDPLSRESNVIKLLHHQDTFRPSTTGKLS